MNLAILGAGLQARAALDDFLRFSGAERVGVADVDDARLAALAAWADDPRVETTHLDVGDEAAVARWLAPYDAALSAVPYRFNLALARAAVASGTHFTDLGGNNDVVDATLALDAEARTAGVRLLPDLGLAPGMVALLGADLVRELAGERALHLRVGGLPQHPEWPLDYRLFFSVGGLTNEYLEPCRVLRDGELVVVPGLSELETLHFPAPFGELEAFQTSGGTSTLIDSLAGEVRELSYKTIRYPGHCRDVRLLRDLGSFDAEPVEVDGALVRPRAVTERLFERHLGATVPDVVLVRITAEGERDGARVRLVEEIVDYPDEARGLSAMQRTTGYPAAILTAMLARGEVPGAGAEPQERCVDAKRFRAALAERGIAIVRREEALA
ncbi:MAG: saccharopine dehydrogenase NADP-binding domain-containing protein [Planctomycetes bacterium]|nr:saccharopine dehydrogenase NADP-binding domain-containing protein [Planctomycetota bacterium]